MGLVAVIDTLNSSQRSARMGLVRNKDTKPELRVRSLVHRLGYRFRLHRRDLPGTPDLVFSGRKKLIFVHGCFWHRHRDPNCALARMPKSRLEFWGPKLEANRLRDEKNLRELEQAGWKVLTIWECQLRDDEQLKKRIREFLK